MNINIRYTELKIAAPIPKQAPRSQEITRCDLSTPCKSNLLCDLPKLLLIDLWFSG